jgi:hypothetical protein
VPPDETASPDRPHIGATVRSAACAVGPLCGRAGLSPLCRPLGLVSTVCCGPGNVRRPQNGCAVDDSGVRSPISGRSVDRRRVSNPMAALAAPAVDQPTDDQERSDHRCRYKETHSASVRSYQTDVNTAFSRGHRHCAFGGPAKETGPDRRTERRPCRLRPISSDCRTSAMSAGSRSSEGLLAPSGLGSHQEVSRVASRV